MRLRTSLRLVPLLAVAALALAPRAGAESHDPQQLAFGWLTEKADAVVVVVPTADRTLGGGRHEVSLTVEDAIRGPLAVGARATMEYQDVGEGRPFTLDARHLAFLRALPVAEGQPARFGLLSGEYGIRGVPAAGPESRFPGLCRKIAETLEANGTVRENAAAYRVLLVEGIEDADSGVAWSAATDLVRHVEMHVELTVDEKRRIVSAYERQPIGNDAKKALALAAAATGDLAAGTALVKSLLHPRAREIQLEVGEALRRLDSPAAAALAAGSLKDADPATRAVLHNVLGAMAPASRAAAPAVRDGLVDAVPAVRVEAAHALGLIAREQHRLDPKAPLVGRVELSTALQTAASENEQLATVWALAQFDEPEAYEALRTLAASDERPLVKKAAERYLANPRLSLVLK